MEITPRQLEIIEATGKILTKSGTSGLTIKNLAKEMNFSESAIYRHFSSKEDIILAMMNFLAESIDQRLTNLPEFLLWVCRLRNSLIFLAKTGTMLWLCFRMD